MNNRLETFKRLYLNGSLKFDELNYFKNNNIINEDEFNQIVNTPKEARATKINKSPYTVKIWNESEDVKTPSGVLTSEEFKNIYKIKNNEKVALFVKGGIVGQVAKIDTLRFNLGLDESVSDLEVGELALQEQISEENSAQVYAEDVALSLGMISDIEKQKDLKEIKEILKEILSYIKERV